MDRGQSKNVGQCEKKTYQAIFWPLMRGMASGWSRDPTCATGDQKRWSKTVGFDYCYGLRAAPPRPRRRAQIPPESTSRQRDARRDGVDISAVLEGGGFGSLRDGRETEDSRSAAGGQVVVEERQESGIDVDEAIQGAQAQRIKREQSK